MRSAYTRTILGYVGANVHRIRAKKGLTQEALAEAADLDLRFAQRVERGSMNLSMDVLVAIAEALDVSIHDLLRPAKISPPKRGRPRKKRPRPT